MPRSARPGATRRTPRPAGAPGSDRSYRAGSDRSPAAGAASRAPWPGPRRRTPRSATRCRAATSDSAAPGFDSPDRLRPAASASTAPRRPDWPTPSVRAGRWQATSRPVRAADRCRPHPWTAPASAARPSHRPSRARRRPRPRAPRPRRGSRTARTPAQAPRAFCARVRIGASAGADSLHRPSIRRG